MTLDRPCPPTPAAAPPARLPARAAASQPSLGDVVARIGAEVSAPLTAALERVLALTATGRIDRQGLQALRSEIDGARRVGLRGQQIARLAGGGLHHSVERLDLAHCLRGVLSGQPVHDSGKRIGLPRTPARAEVLGDASLLHAVLDAAAEWSASLARSNVDWRIDVKPWPVRARVLCRFAHLPADQAAPRSAAGDGGCGHHEPALDTLDWLLLSYAAHMAGVAVQRLDTPSHTLLTLEFLHTVNAALAEAAAADPLFTTGPAGAAASAPAGCQVLVLASQQATRQRLREALQGLELQAHFVSSVADAALRCDDGAPRVLVYEAALAEALVAALQTRLAAVAPALVLVEVGPAGAGCTLRTPGGDPVARMGLDAAAQMLLPLLQLEFGRGPLD